MKSSLSAVEWLYVGVIASLPLFPVRGLPGGVSISLFLMLCMFGMYFVRAVMTASVPAIFSKLDLALLCYLIVALFGMVDTASPEVLFSIGKSTIYMLAYLALKMGISEIPHQRLETLTGVGVIAGTISFGAVMLFALYSTGSLSVLAGNFSYWTVTVGVFSSIDSVFGQARDDFTSVHVMRNSVGEAFSFYVIAALVFGFRRRLTKVYMAVANTVFALSMFSRRALLAICFGVFGASMRQAGPGRKVLAGLGMALGVAGYMFSSGADSRLTDFRDEARSIQYTEAIARFAESPIFGDGYGAKLSSGNYVHNFILSGAMMMGALGLLVTVWIFGKIALDCLRGFRAERGFQTSVFLIVPLLGMLVGSTVEGIFTMTSWVILAIHEVHWARRDNGLSRFSRRGNFDA